MLTFSYLTSSNFFVQVRVWNRCVALSMSVFKIHMDALKLGLISKKLCHMFKIKRPKLSWLDRSRSKKQNQCYRNLNIWCESQKYKVMKTGKDGIYVRRHWLKPKPSQIFPLCSLGFMVSYQHLLYNHSLLNFSWGWHLT